MRTVFFGTGEFGVPALRAMVAAGHPVIAAVSQPDRPAGRGLALRPTPVRQAAEALGIPHIQAADVNADDPASLVNDAEIVVVAAFGQKLGPALLRAAPRGCVNLHASLLPRHRGAAPHQWAILRGDLNTGVTIFQLNERWDAGPILGTVQTEIGESETADELHDRLSQLAAPLLVETLAALAAGTIQPRMQNPAEATRAPKLTRADSRIEFNEDARHAAARIHGLWSWPTATSEFVSQSGRRERLQLARCRVLDGQAPPGAGVAAGVFLADGSLQCARGRLRLLEVRPAGGKLMPFASFANGRRLAAGDRLEPIDSP